MTRLRLVFFGTPDFAVPALRALLASAHPVVGVITQPDRPRGRGQRVAESPVKHVAAEAGLPVLQPDRLKDDGFLHAFRAWRADLGVVAAYGKILPGVVLDTPPLGLVNVHASLLPRYRGAAPVHRAVMDGEAETGVSIMQVVQALDAGGVFATARRLIRPDETSTEVEADLARLGATILLPTIDAIATGAATCVAQDEAQATYAPRLQKHEGAIDWSESATSIHNRVRGLQPWPMASSWLSGRRLILVQTSVHDPVLASGSPPGTILEARGGRMLVQAGLGVVALLRVQSEGRRAMAVRDYLAGRAVQPGAAFTASV
ncbi:MAG: methionyl-tRNA formyltransferase [Acidobacteriota bacterium]